MAAMLTAKIMGCTNMMHNQGLLSGYQPLADRVFHENILNRLRIFSLTLGWHFVIAKIFTQTKTGIG